MSNLLHGNLRIDRKLSKWESIRSMLWFLLSVGVCMYGFYHLMVNIGTL